MGILTSRCSGRSRASRPLRGKGRAERPAAERQGVRSDRARGIAMRFLAASALFGCLLVSGCSEHTLVDPGYALIPNLRVTHIEPSEYSPGAPMNLTVVFDSRYAGSGWFSLVGHGGGSDVGLLLEPEAAQIGFYSQRLTISAGRTEIPLTLLMTTTLDMAALSITVAIDSLLANDSLVPWNSPEGYDVFRADVPRGAVWISNTNITLVEIQRARSMR